MHPIWFSIECFTAVTPASRQHSSEPKNTKSSSKNQITNEKVVLSVKAWQPDGAIQTFHHVSYSPTRELRESI